MTPLKTRNELAEYFQVSPITIDRWKAKGMPCIVIGGSTRYDIEKVIDWANKTKNE